MNNTVSTDLLSATRLGSTINGNPTWMLHTTDGDYRVSNDSSVSYDVNNLIPRRGETAAQVTLHLTRAGRVWKIDHA